MVNALGREKAMNTLNLIDFPAGCARAGR